MRDLDRDFNGTQDGGGPCEVHLRSKFGKMRELVFGAVTRLHACAHCARCHVVTQPLLHFRLNSQQSAGSSRSDAT